MKNDYVRRLIKEHNLTPHAQAIFTVLCCHANKNALTFIGHRKIAELTNMNKDTVTKHIKELIASGLVGRSEEKINGRVSCLRIIAVPNETERASEAVGHKEIIKENIKDKKITEYKGHEKMLEGINQFKKLKSDKNLCIK